MVQTTWNLKERISSIHNYNIFRFYTCIKYFFLYKNFFFICISSIIKIYKLR